MITVYDIEIPDYLKNAHIFLLVFELLLIIPGVGVVLVCEISTRVPVTVILDAVRCTAASAVLLSIPILTLERVVATIRIKSYEKERHRLLVVVFLLFCYLGCCVNAYLIVQVGVPLTTFISFGMVWLVVNLVAFQRLVNWSQFEYEKQMKTNVQPLTVRFQLSENVRLGKILLASLRAFCFAGALTFLIIFLIILVTVPYAIAWATFLLYHLFEIAIASSTALIGLTIVNADKKWAMEFNRAVFVLCKRKNVFPVKNITSVFSLAGSQLVFRQETEGRTYFDNLRSQWQ